jgi:hypothetical protein
MVEHISKTELKLRQAYKERDVIEGRLSKNSVVLSGRGFGKTRTAAFFVINSINELTALERRIEHLEMRVIKILENRANKNKKQREYRRNKRLQKEAIPLHSWLGEENGRENENKV